MVKKNLINYSFDLVLLCLFIIVGFMGLLIFPGLLSFFGININDLPKIQLYRFHHLIGLLLILFMSIHFKFHWSWYTTVAKRLLQKNYKQPMSKIKYILNIGLLISFLVSAITGVLKFPGLLPFLGINPLGIPVNELSFLHDWSGLFIVVFSIVHIGLHASWFKQTTLLILNRDPGGRCV